LAVKNDSVSFCVVSVLAVKNSVRELLMSSIKRVALADLSSLYEGWNFNSGNYLFTTDTK